jgi:peroxiredoxin
MPALIAGANAPEFTLVRLGSQDRISVQKDNSAVLVFFKIECPVCQYALPYFDRLYQQVAKQNPQLKFIGVSQNDAKGTAGFVEQFGLTFPIGLDEAPRYTVSNAFGLTNVPTFFLVSNGVVEMSSVSWMKDDVMELHHRLTQESATTVPPLFSIGEDVAAFKAG